VEKDRRVGNTDNQVGSRALPAREPGASGMIRSALGRLAETLVLAWAVGAVVFALFALVGCTQGELHTEAEGVDTPAAG
jgi:hypothetical protein